MVGWGDVMLRYRNHDWVLNDHSSIRKLRDADPAKATEMGSVPTTKNDRLSAHPAVKPLVFAFIAVVMVAGYALLGDRLTLDALAAQEIRLRELTKGHPVAAYAIALAIYVAVTGLSLPGATVLTLVYGWLFGLAGGVLLVSFASTLGATIAFLLSRYLFRDAIEHRFGHQLRRFNDQLARSGPYYLFTLRLIPAIPFFVINAVMGLTSIATRTFWWVSQLGMLPGTVVYIYAGSSVPSLAELSQRGVGAIFNTEVLIAFALLAALPFVVRWVVAHMKGYAGATPPASEPLNDN